MVEPIYMSYVDWVGEGDCTRSEAARQFGVSKGTARYHLERAVDEGYLVRVHTYATKNQRGWVYTSPGGDLFDGLDEEWGIDRE